MDIASCDELLTTTRAVRRRLDLTRTVSRDVILECLQLAVQAPTGGHSEQWRWIVVDDPEQRTRLAELYAEGKHVLEDGAERATREKARRAYEGALYLLSVLDRVPVHVIPCIRGRIADGTSSPPRASSARSCRPSGASCSPCEAEASGRRGRRSTSRRRRRSRSCSGSPATTCRWRSSRSPTRRAKRSDLRRAGPGEEITYWNGWQNGG